MIEWLLTATDYWTFIETVSQYYIVSYGLGKFHRQRCRIGNFILWLFLKTIMNTEMDSVSIDTAVGRFESSVREMREEKTSIYSETI